MPGQGYAKDVGAYAKAEKLHLAQYTQASHSGAAQDGDSLDAAKVDGPEQYQSAELQIEVDATGTLTGSQTLDTVINLQDSEDGSSWADVAAGTLLSTDHVGPGDLTAKSLDQLTGGGTETLSASFAVELARLRRYVRVQVTPTFTGGGDTALYSVVFVAGGAKKLPV